MTRLTKADIQNSLLSGERVTWRDANGKNCYLQLDDAKKRRLLEFVLGAAVREPTGLSPDFVNGLAAAYGAATDPATIASASSAASTSFGPWRLRSIDTEGFGGLNTWKGGPFHLDFDQQSLLLEGPNGSGKSSLTGAILWALTGERPRDHTDAQAHEPKPVFADSDKPAGNWPPIAVYPPSIAELQSPPTVRVLLTFESLGGPVATVERRLVGGKVTPTIDAAFGPPSILIETGLQMPARLAQLRLDEGSGRLTDAVQKLTGLDDLVAIGTLAEGLCHKGREYRSYKKQELATAKSEFERALDDARTALSDVTVTVPSFAPADTDDDKGAMATLGKTLTEQAAELAQVVSGDLASGLKLSSAQVQIQVNSNILAAKEDLKIGLEGLETWKTLQSIAQGLDQDSSKGVLEAVGSARKAFAEAIQLLEKSIADSRFQLKAVAARWHSDHKTGAVENCPLCERELKTIPSLAEELEVLRSSGAAAARTFDDNLNAIRTSLDSAIPEKLKTIGAEVLTLEPQAAIVADIRATFVSKDRYSKCLVKVAAIAEDALAKAPPKTSSGPVVPKTTDESSELLKSLNQRIAVVERLLELASWFQENSPEWKAWWQTLAAAEIPASPPPDHEEAQASTVDLKSERLMPHLSRLSDALSKAEPYRKAAEALRKAWKSGKIAAEIEKEVALRDAVAESLTSLKDLGPLCEAVARDAINDLSDRITKLLDRIHLTEQLRFHNARLHRKTGLVVQGGFVPELHIDATLVANTSWLRAVLWAFMFALREEAVEQLGTDPFPLIIFDDPQATFDGQHRHRWAQYVASKQNGTPGLQLILTTHDETFLDLIKVDGVTGRQALITASGPDRDHAGIFEGASLDREWVKAKSENTPKAAVEYMDRVRVYVEGLLKLMLRGSDADISGLALGSLRDRINQYHNSGRAPWDQAAFKVLVGKLDPGRPEVKYIEGAHHTTGHNYGMGEADSVEQFWRKELSPSVHRAFRTAREHRLLHGGMTALYAVPPTVVLPEGYQTKVRTIPLKVLGRAAALSDGRIADGTLDMDEFPTGEHVSVILGRHFAYRLTARTLEPVARSGDILLIKEHAEPSPKSLVVALSEESILARRFELAENHSDVAVLTAQAINPREIAPPVIAHRSTFALHKVIGVLFEDSPWRPSGDTGMEVCDCGGEAVISRLTADALGLVEVVGQSAEPLALNGQYLIVKSAVAAKDAIKLLDGRPIIAADTEDRYYFKRLRVTGGDYVVLESLDSGGDYGPVLLSAPGSTTNALVQVWPVVGILFERT